MPLLLMLWCNVVKRNWTIILMQTVLHISNLDYMPKRILIQAIISGGNNRHFMNKMDYE